jgi:DNA replication and repair protein RecF
MRLLHLALTNFRNYKQLDLDLPAGPVLLHGANAQGKTTLLEAIYYLATSKSPHASNDRQLLHWYANGPENPLAVGRLTAQIQTGRESRPQRIEIRLIRELNVDGESFRREVLINGAKVRLMDLLGHLNVVLFLPEDVALVSASPSERRRYLDITLCQVDRRYCRTLSQFNKVLSQRNALLKALQERRGRVEELEPWDKKLTELGAAVMVRRAQLTADLERRAGQIHFEELTAHSESLRLDYQPRLVPNGFDLTGVLPEKGHNDPAAWLQEEPLPTIVETLRKILQTSFPMERQRGVTLSGPHRDDLRFLVNGRDLGDYGSRGQQRTAILALKLAEVAWMESQTGDRPVLLLDEVLAELDQARRSYLLQSVGSAEQSFLTATDLNMFTDEFVASATHMEVVDGQIRQVNHPSHESV